MHFLHQRVTIKYRSYNFFNASHRFYLPFVCCLTTIPKSGIIHVSTAFGGCLSVGVVILLVRAVTTLFHFLKHFQSLFLQHQSL
nr:MAG TPA_asm: hypothetical protein [Caudoviricetes sp.]